MNDTVFYKELEKQAIRIVEEAVQILVSHENSFTIATQKDEVDVATNADIEVENFIKSEVRKLYPEHGFEGEEFGKEKSESEFVWIIDPLDNTKEYVRGLGEYNCLVAIEHNKKLVVGITRRKGHEILYTCSLSTGSFADGKHIHVSTTKTLNTAFIGTNMPNKKHHPSEEVHQYVKLFESLIQSVYRLRPDFDDARTLGWVAQGGLDACILLPNTDKWVDVASGILLVEEAGGKVTNWEGKPILNHDVTKGVLASNGLLHEQLLQSIHNFI